jgi:AraC-like DNA-binding protein
MNLLSDSFPLRMLNIEQCLVDNKWDYRDVCSPFFRMYYIINGEGYICHNESKIMLQQDKLVLIPNYTSCNYYCDNSLEMIYIIFINQLNYEKRIYNFNDHVFEVDGREMDKLLFKRLLELNPSMELIDYDPKKYDNLNYLDKCKQYEKQKSLEVMLESQGILLQLFSRFTPPENQQINLEDSSGLKIFYIIQFIDQNLSKNLSVKLLAKETCLSPDYFSRLFFKITKTRPIEFIQRKRIEKVQLLLATTNDSLENISDQTGLNNASYLTRLFKRYTGKSPGKYRNDRF